MTCLEQHHLATGSAIGENELMDNAFAEAPLPSHHRRSAVALAPEQRSPPLAGFYASNNNNNNNSSQLLVRVVVDQGHVMKVY